MRTMLRAPAPATQELLELAYLELDAIAARGEVDHRAHDDEARERQERRARAVVALSQELRAMEAYCERPA